MTRAFQALLLFACLACLLALAAAACGGSEPGRPDAGASVPPDAEAAGLDASVPEDAAAPGLDAATPPDADMPPDAASPGLDAGPPCTRQTDCGDPLWEEVADVCVDLQCRPPGPAGSDGTTERVMITFPSVYATTFAQPSNQPRTQLTRLILDTYVDGSPATCANLRPRAGSTEATRSKLDDDPMVNQAYRALFNLDWSTVTPQGPVFPVPGRVPKGAHYVVYAEAWYGPRDGQQPTSDRASVYCREGINLSNADTTTQLRLDFNP